jgi:hypothetical protein
MKVAVVGAGASGLAGGGLRASEKRRRASDCTLVGTGPPVPARKGL